MRSTRAGKMLLISLLVVVGSILMMPAVTHAQEKGEKDARTVRVGWYESTFCYRDQFGRRCGIAYEYQQKIVPYTGWKYEYVEDSWPNLLEMLQKGEIDILSDVSYTEERTKTMLFPNLPMGEESYYIYIDADTRNLTTENLESFNGKKIGVNKGSIQAGFLRQWARKNGITPQIIDLTEEEAESMEMLASGEIDAYVTTNTFGSEESIIPLCKVGASAYYFAVNKDRPDLLKEMNLALSTIQEEDPYFNQRMTDEYMSLTRTDAFLTPSQEEWLEKHGTIRVGYRDDYLPFCDREEKTGELTGALRDYLTHAVNALKNANMDFEAVPYTSTEDALKALKEGKIDCMFPLSLSTYEAEEMGVLITDTVMQSGMDVVVRKTDVEGIKPGRKMKVSINKENINYETFLRDYFPGWEIIYCDTPEECFVQVAERKADCTILSNYRVNEAERILERNGLTALPSGETMSLSFAVPIEDYALYAILDKTINLTKKEDMDSALVSYVPSNQRVSFAQFLRYNWLGVLAFITVVFVVILLILLRALRAERRASERQKQIDAEKIARQKDKEASLRRALRQKKKLDSAMQMAYTDPLTGVKSKHAYVQAEEKFDERIEKGQISEFGVVVFDLNDLKKINDTLGHEVGDQYIRDACNIICKCFQHSPVYRIGGDEFAAILEGSDYENREELMSGFNRQIEENAAQGKIVVASGYARFRAGEDNSFSTVFERADEKMYNKKKQQKSSDPAR